MHIRIVLNILRQSFAHTLATVTVNKYMNFMSIGVLVVELFAIDDGRAFEESNQASMHIRIVLNI